MSFEIRTTPGFERSAKVLSKRHRSLKADLKELMLSLSSNPFQGDELTPGVRKIRMAITSKGRGKSGGARVITFTIVIEENSGTVYLLDIYDKSDFASVEISVIKELIEELEL